MHSSDRIPCVCLQAAKEFEDKVAKPVADFTQVWTHIPPPPFA